VAWWLFTLGANVKQQLDLRWAFVDLRHHPLVLKVDRELGGCECLARLLGIIDLLGIDEDGPLAPWSR